mmetsp:Transcript_39240/g.106178  ORF Transcript_39240/g.106178 Transcript_39240/m.106178 type:complete len:345 (-) Transcript_39240:180-1214(-)
MTEPSMARPTPAVSVHEDALHGSRCRGGRDALEGLESIGLQAQPRRHPLRLPEDEPRKAEVDPAVQHVGPTLLRGQSGCRRSVGRRGEAPAPEAGGLPLALPRSGRQAQPLAAARVVAVVGQELGERGGLRQLAQVVHDADPLRNGIELPRERLGILDQGVVWPGDGRVLVGAGDQLPSLNAHLHAGDQDVVLRDVDLRLQHDEPDPRVPLRPGDLAPRELPAAGHAGHRLLELAHGELLQVIVSLEEHVAHTRPGKPLRAEVLGQHGGRARGVDRVQREPWLSTLQEPHLQRNGEVVQVHGNPWVVGPGEAHRELVLVDRQAAHALGIELHSKSSCQADVARN